MGGQGSGQKAKFQDKRHVSERLRQRRLYEMKKNPVHLFKFLLAQVDDETQRQQNKVYTILAEKYPIFLRHLCEQHDITVT